MDAPEAKDKIQSLITNIESVIKGKRLTVELAVVALICDGQLLIEDVPGVGKTMLARAMARSIDAAFQRIQFTPDLLPSDVTGISVYNQRKEQFEFQPGPIFANIVLIDEINRTTPRTQSSLLEAMEEHQVTVDHKTHRLPEPFFVIATQNPVEFYGTYPLPEGQRDRFLISVGLGYPSFETEREIATDQLKEHPIERLSSVLSLGDVLKLQRCVRDVHIDTDLLDYSVALVQATRDHPSLLLGASPRGSLSIVRTARAAALLEGRDFVTPEDIKRMAVRVLPHRFVTSDRSRRSTLQAEAVMAEILEKVPVPLRVGGLGGEST